MWNGYDPFNCNEDEKMIKTGCIRLVLYLAAVFIALAACSLFSGCSTTKYVPVIEYHTDTLIQTKVVHDSIYINDSTVITEKGDTVRIEKWHTKYITRESHDTLYISKTDTIPKPYPVEKEVPAELTWWQQMRIHIGGIVIFLALIWLSIKYLFPFIRRRFGW